MNCRRNIYRNDKLKFKIVVTYLTLNVNYYYIFDRKCSLSATVLVAIKFKKKIN